MVETQEKTDEELVSLTLEDQNAFLYLVNRYEAKLFSYILKISNLDSVEAEDVLQDVFIKVYKNLNAFDADLKFSSWIYRITHNEVISNFRKKKARPEKILTNPEDDVMERIADELDIERQIDLKTIGENIYKILNEMEEKYKEVLILKFLEEKDYKEISDILKKPMGTVATLINRAKKQFKEKVKELGINF